MKIGIMSMQRIANYGSFLQAYALKSMIKSLGHKVCFVDYRIGKPVTEDLSMPETKNYGNVMIYVRLLLKKLLKKEIYFSETYKTFLPKLGINEKRRYNTKVDTLVIGSDEVFNCLQSNPDVGFSPELFGKNANTEKVISFAASFGFTTSEGLKKVGKYDEIKEYLKNFKSLSLRDKNSVSLAEEMGAENIYTHIDPVLLYDFTDKIKEKKDISDYIIVYSYDGRISNEDEIAAIKNFAKKHGKKIVTIGFHQNWSDIKITANPFVLLGYFKNADYVVTDTFHGTIFSIITKRKFGTIIRESNRQKLSSLLEKLCLEDRIVSNINELEEVVAKNIDYKKTVEIIESERQKSIEYLKENL